MGIITLEEQLKKLEKYNNKNFQINRSAYYFLNENEDITNTSAESWNVPVSVSAREVCEQINAQVKELGIQIHTDHKYWLSTSDHPELDGRLWDEVGLEVPIEFLEFLEEVPTKKVGYPSQWSIYFWKGYYYEKSSNPEVEFIYVDNHMNNSTEEDPILIQNSQEEAERVKDLLNQAYQQGITDTTTKLTNLLE
jgi:hypothetical protein